MVAVRRRLAILLVIAASCSRASAPSATSVRPALDPNVIKQEELQDPVFVGMDALKVINQLRPAFLRATGPQSFINTAAGGVQFSHDYGPLRPVSELATINTFLLVEIRYLSATEAQGRFGLNANGGPVIVLLNNKQ
jgi:hypothetical protein